MRVTLWALILGCVLAQSAVGQPSLPQDKVLLEYKFVKGALLRYKIEADVNAGLGAGKPGSGDDQQRGTTHAVAVIRMRCQRVLADGSAEFTSAVESLTVTKDGKADSEDVKKIPTQSFIMAKTGGAKWLTPTGRPATVNDDDTLQQMMSSITDLTFPGKELKAGDTWDILRPNADQRTQLQLKATLARTGAVAAGHKTAEISVKANLKPTSASASVTGSLMTLRAGFDFEGKYYFSPEMGCLVESESSLALDLDVLLQSAGGAKGEQPADETPKKTDDTSGDMMVNMKFKVELLPD